MKFLENELRKAIQTKRIIERNIGLREANHFIRLINTYKGNKIMKTKLTISIALTLIGALIANNTNDDTRRIQRRIKANKPIL